VDPGHSLQYNAKRVPSYTDRILWRSLPGSAPCLTQNLFFAANNLVTSDHKPVWARFSLSLPPPLSRIVRRASMRASKSRVVLRLGKVELKLFDEKVKASQCAFEVQDASLLRDEHIRLKDLSGSRSRTIFTRVPHIHSLSGTGAGTPNSKSAHSIVFRFFENTGFTEEERGFATLALRQPGGARESERERCEPMSAAKADELNGLSHVAQWSVLSGKDFPHVSRDFELEVSKDGVRKGVCTGTLELFTVYDPLLEVVQKATLRTGHDGKSEKMGELGVGDVLICHRK